MLGISNDQNIKKLEMIDPMNGRWAVRWNLHSLEDGQIEFQQQIFNKKPSLIQIKNTIEQWYNNCCSAKIIDGLIWNGHKIYLDSQSQQNIGLICLTYSLQDKFEPIVVKIGGEDTHERYTFTSKEELSDFCFAVAKHVQNCLEECYINKQNINLEEYK